MTGRSVHDALLRVLTSAELRRDLAGSGSHSADATIGPEAAAVLRGADPERLGRLARFMARHFYRERIVRLFAASRALARRSDADPLAILDTPAFDALLDEAELGSTATAERVATMVEAALRAPLGGFPFGRDLAAYEGVLFRAEAGPRRWQDPVPGEIPVQSAHARIGAFRWDVTGLVAAVRRGDLVLPDPSRGPTRLLIALGPGGRVTTLRCPDAVERLLAALDGVRTVAETAAMVGVSEADARRVLLQLTEVGAVEWRSAAC